MAWPDLWVSLTTLMSRWTPQHLLSTAKQTGDLIHSTASAVGGGGEAIARAFDRGGELVTADRHLLERAGRGLICALVCPIRVGVESYICQAEHCQVSKGWHQISEISFFRKKMKLEEVNWVLRRKVWSMKVRRGWVLPQSRRRQRGCFTWEALCWEWERGSIRPTELRNQFFSSTPGFWSTLPS